jgi:hypothetical protein
MLMAADSSTPMTSACSDAGGSSPTWMPSQNCAHCRSNVGLWTTRHM